MLFMGMIAEAIATRLGHLNANPVQSVRQKGAVELTPEPQGEPRRADQPTESKRR